MAGSGGPSTSGNSTPSQVSLCCLGHAKSGKSTLLGRWLVDLGCCEPAEAERAKERGEYAALWDRQPIERAAQMTIDLHVRSARVGQRVWSVTDTPGHRRHLRNLLTGLSSSDTVLLVVDATRGVFEANVEDGGVEEGVPSQIREHLLMLHALGIKQIVVAVNKMDVVTHTLKLQVVSKSSGAPAPTPPIADQLG
ncbi:hypothetical protein FOA52_012357 [Chlamydomonas sp. UWO 241]|nr:hypothetical protein FOA52_012357 [Chlamydomonas sp. UWO 241]